ncbi:hypothetical protein HYH03_011650 [Edaphochlamys debaryana]|uniref:Peptidase M11 gametolysin domain-containing protein n=1 Tax=Edaphochlamys debaryana TaxID=47281 RepID=A0A835XUD1_9CHLO|nr:hypothetical protein HYH03_011650 [Edaphochlamys debaryana]|eukprot:KAG2489847.1 hypothetical protein HYH03_011650 [Edaphochlamys debaryana]
MSDNHLFETAWFLIRQNDSMSFQLLPGQPRNPVTQQLVPVGSAVRLLCTPAPLPYTCANVSNVTVTFSPSASRGLAVNVTVNLLVVVLRLSDSEECSGSEGADVTRLSDMLWGPRGVAEQLQTCSYGNMRLNQQRSQVRELTLQCRWDVMLCDHIATSNIARQEVRRLIPNLNAFTHFMYVMPDASACQFQGISEQLGRTSWIRPGDLGVFKPGTVMQELLHNYGLYHGWRDDTEYVDGSTFMGMAQSACPSAPELLRLGWATPLAVLNRNLLPEATLDVYNVTIPATQAGPAGVTVRILPDWLPGDAYTKNLYLSLRTRVNGDWQMDEEYVDQLSIHEALRAADNGAGSSTEDPRFNLVALLEQGTKLTLDSYRLVVQARELLVDSKARRMMVDVCRFRFRSTECRMPPIPTM